MADTASLTDNFDDNSVDGTKWPFSFGTVAETGGQARVTALANGDASGYEATGQYSIKDSSVTAWMAPPSAEASTYAVARLASYDIASNYGHGVAVWTDRVSGEFGWYAFVDGITQFDLSFTPGTGEEPLVTTGGWFRVEETGGTLTLLTSADGGATWPVVDSQPTPAAVRDSTTLTIDLEAYRSSTTGPGTAAAFDNVNLPPVPVVDAGVDGQTRAGDEFVRTATSSGGPVDSWAWTVEAGPDGVGSTIGADATLSWTPSVEGTYTLRATASNGGGDGFDELDVVVTPAVVEQDGSDSAEVMDDATMDVVAQTFPMSDTGSFDDDAVMDIVAQSFYPSDSATVTDAASMRIVDSRAVLGTAALRIDFWLLDDDGSYVCPLPHVVSFQLSLIAGEPGTVNLEYAAAGINAGLLRAAVTRTRDALIAIRFDGTDATSLRARLNAADGNQVAESGTVTYSGNFLTRRLAEIVVAYQQSTDKGELVFGGATAGQIMGTALVQAQSRGTGVELSWDFTNTHDSNGLPWPTQTSINISPGMKLLDLAAKLRDWGMAETEITSDFVVRMYVPESVGIHWELGDTPVILRHGRDLTEAPRQVSTEDAPTDLLLAGDEGVYEQLHDDTARAERGRQVEAYESQGNLADSGSLIAYGNLQLSRLSAGTESNTYAIAVREGGPMPLRDLHPSDWVLTDTGEGVRDPERIVQLTVSGQSGDDRYQASATVNDLIAEQDVVLARRLDDLLGGAIVAGTSVSSPAADDGLAPAAPEGVGAISLAYYDDAAPKATLAASWGAVITNEDGSPISDLSGYQAQYRYGTGQDLPTDWVQFGNSSTPDASTDGLVQGKVVDVRALAYDRFGRLSEWSDVYSLVTATDADAPPTPSTPTVESYIGILTVAWDGLGSAGEAQPGDFDHVEIHVSTVDGFTPDRPVLADGRLDTAASSTYLDRLFGAGIMPWADGTYGATYFVKLVAVDRTGNASDASEQDSAELVEAGDGDISSVSIGKLTAGIMSALMTVSGLIRTANSGGRVEVDNGGLRLYRPNETLSMKLDATNGDVTLFKTDGTTAALKLTASTGLIEMIGKLTAGASATSGARIIVDPNVVPNPTVYFYTATSTRQPAFMNGFANLSDSLSVGLGINSGYSSTGRVARVVLDPDDGGWLVYSDGATQGERGGRVAVEEGGAAVAAFNDSGVARAALDVNDDGSWSLANFVASSGITVEADGDIRLTPASGKEITSNRPIGSLGAGFSFHAQNGSSGGYRMVSDGSYLRFVENASNQYLNDPGGPGGYKCFVIDHPTDPDRYLVHACTEAPAATVEYRGTATIVDHEAVVELPPYFEAATTEDRHVQVTLVAALERVEVPAVPPGDPYQGPEGPGAPLPAPTPGRPATPEHALLSRVAASPIVDGRFRIVSDAPDGTAVNWHVQATRADSPQFEVEPLRSDVEVSGFGPYRTFTRRDPAA